jgi:hypothetical protein
VTKDILDIPVESLPEPEDAAGERDDSDNYVEGVDKDEAGEA